MARAATVPTLISICLAVSLGYFRVSQNPFFLGLVGVTAFFGIVFRYYLLVFDLNPLRLKESLDDLNPYYRSLMIVGTFWIGFTAALLHTKANLDSLHTWYNLLECLVPAFSHVYIVLLFRYFYLKFFTMDECADDGYVLFLAFFFMLLPVTIRLSTFEPVYITEWLGF